MISLRDATADDAGLISRIIANSWRTAYQGLIDDAYLARLPEEYWLPSMQSWLDSGRMYGLIAEDRGMPVGCLVYGRGRDAEYASWGEIVSLYVLPQITRRGVGSLLLKAALDSLAADGYQQVYLWAIDGNASADQFYRRHSFRRTEKLVHYKIGSQEVTDVCYVREG